MNVELQQIEPVLERDSVGSGTRHVGIVGFYSSRLLFWLSALRQVVPWWVHFAGGGGWGEGLYFNIAIFPSCLSENEIT